MPDREILVPAPIAVGMTDSGRIVLEYEDTSANRQMARRVAAAMMADEGDAPSEVENGT